MSAIWSRALTFALVALVVLVGSLAAAWAVRAGALPADIPPTQRARLEPVTGAATVTTRVEAEPFPGRREVFEFLLDHPEFATYITRTLKLARYRIWRTPEGLFLDDGWGTRGHFDVVHAGSGLRVMYARGAHEQRFLPSVRGQAVVLIEYATRPCADGAGGIATTVSGYVKLDSRVLAAAGTLVGSWVGDKADLEARRLVKVFAKTTHAVESDPSGVYEKLRARPDVPGQDLETFRSVLRLP